MNRTTRQLLVQASADLGFTIAAGYGLVEALLQWYLAVA